MDLVRFRVPAPIVRMLLSRRPIYQIQTIESGSSERVNLDYYPVYVKRMPVVDGRRLSASQLFHRLRTDLNRFVDSDMAKFTPASVRDKVRWKSSSPLSVVLHIDIPFDDGYVVCSRANAKSWRFSTVTRGIVRTDEHPVSGTREFGMVGADMRAVIYTRGADRGSWAIDRINAQAFAGGHRLWMSFQRRLVEYVNSQGGSAQLFMVGTRGEPWIVQRPKWPAVRRLR